MPVTTLHIWYKYVCLAATQQLEKQNTDDTDLTDQHRDKRKLSSELGVVRETVYSYIAFLEGTYFILDERKFTTVLAVYHNSFKQYFRLYWKILHICKNIQT